MVYIQCKKTRKNQSIKETFCKKEDYQGKKYRNREEKREHGNTIKSK